MWKEPAAKSKKNNTKNSEYSAYVENDSMLIINSKTTTIIVQRVGLLFRFNDSMKFNKSKTLHYLYENNNTNLNYSSVYLI